MNIGLLLTIVAAAFAIIAAFSQRFIKREKSFDTNASLEHHLLAGNKINAIKAYRQQTGAGLKEAKEVVERMQVGLAGTAAGVSSQQSILDPDELQRLIQAKQKLHAIKYYRETTGVGLKEAKEAVDWLEVQIRQQT